MNLWNIEIKLNAPAFKMIPIKDLTQELLDRIVIQLQLFCFMIIAVTGQQMTERTFKISYDGLYLGNDFWIDNFFIDANLNI